MLFEGLIVLALDLQLGLELLDEQLKTGDFGFELDDVGTGGRCAEAAWRRGRRCGPWSESFGKRAWPGVFRRRHGRRRNGGLRLLNRWHGNRLWRRCKQVLQRTGADVALGSWRGRSDFGAKQRFDPANQFLGLKGLAN